MHYNLLPREEARATDYDVREQMAGLGSNLPRILGKLFQAFLTWITGKPHRGQTPFIRLNSVHHFWLTLLCLFLGVSISVFAIRRGHFYLLLLLPSLALTVSAQRKLFLSIVHGTLHGTFVRSVRISRIVADTITLLIFSPPYSYLYTAHVGKHHGKAFCTLEDPDAQALYAFGMRPGMKRDNLWKCFLRTMFSPRFHATFLWLRIQTNFRISSPMRLIAVLVVGALTVLLLHRYHAWFAFAIAWLIPNIVGFQIAALVNFAGEHRWYSEPGKGSDRLRWYLQRTHGRFVGSRLPDRYLSGWQRYLAWLRWWFVLLFWHLPLRLMIIPADMPAHDHHHANVKGDWANAIYDRQRALEAGAPYTETWGVFKAIDLFFDELAQLPPINKPSLQHATIALMDM